MDGRPPSRHTATTDLDISGEDIVCLKNDRANHCYAVLLVSNKVHTSVRTMGITNVACEQLSGVAARQGLVRLASCRRQAAAPAIWKGSGADVRLSGSGRNPPGGERSGLPSVLPPPYAHHNFA